MSEHRIILVEKADDRHTPDEALIELTVRHGQCAMCHAPLYLAPEAIVLTRAHVDGSFNMQRFCDDVCLTIHANGRAQKFGED